MHQLKILVTIFSFLATVYTYGDDDRSADKVNVDCKKRTSTFPLDSQTQNNLNQFVRKKVKRIPQRKIVIRKNTFDIQDVYNLCAVLRARRQDVYYARMDTLIRKGKITKEQWNKDYAFRVSCIGMRPLMYAANRNRFEDFKLLIEYGIDPEHFVKDRYGNISTILDIAKYQNKVADKEDRYKWKKIYKYLKKRNVRGCKDLPELKCTATYI